MRGQGSGTGAQVATSFKAKVRGSYALTHCAEPAQDLNSIIRKWLKLFCADTPGPANSTIGFSGCEGF